jgi:glycosyltransferase involved in cell wall biosynthesis
MRIAVIVRDLAPGTGLNLVVENLLQGLAERHEIRIFVLFRGYYGGRSEKITLPYPSEEYIAGSAVRDDRTLSRASRYYGADVQRLAWLENRIADFGAERIVGFDYNVAPFVGLLQTAIPKILNVVDSEVLYYLGQIRNGNFVPAIIKHFVAAWLVGREHFRKCAAVVTVSPSDTASLRRFAGVRNAFTVPNGVDHRRYSPDPSVVRSPNRIVFCGSLNFLPNLQAIQRFVSRCWPDIRRRRPNAELLIIGKNPGVGLAPLLEAQPGIRVAGYVDDVRSHISGSAISVAPMVSGCGIKNKILEAWALGTPVVATPLAVRGLVCQDNVNVLVAESASEFAASVASLLGDPEKRERIGAAGRSNVIRNYRWEISRAKFNTIVEQPSAYREIEVAHDNYAA